MAGHSHWKQIKVKKATSDKRKGALFSKLLNAVSVAAKHETNPQFNPRLRTAVEKAREAEIPKENIERAIKKSEEAGNQLEEIMIEAYGPGSVGMLIEAATPNKNKTIQEIKLLLKEHNSKIAEPGSVSWVFNKTNEEEWTAKFTKETNDSEKKGLSDLINALHEREDVQKIFTNSV